MDERSETRVCIIGAGSSGLAAARCLKLRGIPFDWFEKGSHIGGNWKYGNDNGVSAAYRSLHLNSSKRFTEYPSFPMPDDYPDYPNHWQVWDYLDAYAKANGLYELIRFNTEVTKARPLDGGGWEVTLSDGSTHAYSDLVVCNGHHWDKKLPSFPGEDSFTGTTMHAHDYDSEETFAGKRVLVLGIGNSACDIACDASHVAEKTLLAMRRSAWVIPKHLGGKPIDAITPPAIAARLPMPLWRAGMARLLKRTQGDMTDWGMAEPDHKILQAHPTVSSELLPRLGHGDITIKPNIERFDGDEVVFEDGSRERIDIVVYATGYKITFPFLEEGLVGEDNTIGLYQRVVHPDLPGLYFIALVQPIGSVLPLTEVQGDWVGDLIAGDAALPSAAEMHKEIESYERNRQDQFVASTRHTIEVSYWPYVRELNKERKRSRRRASKAA